MKCFRFVPPVFEFPHRMMYQKFHDDGTIYHLSSYPRSSNLQQRVLLFLHGKRMTSRLQLGMYSPQNELFDGAVMVIVFIHAEPQLA